MRQFGLANFMLTLGSFPKNKDQLVRLMEFLKDFLDICNALNITPVLHGSLAVFAYTKDQNMNVNDIDLCCSEMEFPTITNVLDERNINYKLKEWHVLQILKNDLKIELDSTEYWYKGLPMKCETLQLDTYTINMLDLNSLREFYRRGLKNRADKIEENEKTKYEALKSKFEALEKIKG